jgi:uncharacterized damage-inducible protein DinB
MKLKDLFLADLEREAANTRKVLARVPAGRYDFKPHEKSMRLGYLATLVADMPAWIELMVNHDELDLKPTGSPVYEGGEPATSGELVARMEASVEAARKALTYTTDEHLLTNWQFKVFGNVVQEGPRHIMIREAVLSHLAHHRGQLTVYLRLNEAAVPALYGPSADER